MNSTAESIIKRYHKEKKAKSAISELIARIIVKAIFGGLCFPYVINTWLVYFDKNQHVSWWQGVLIGIMLPYSGKIDIPLVIATWIAMLFLRG
jgi:hypothetical protein